MAEHANITPECREARFVCATPQKSVRVRQPLPRGVQRLVTGNLLGSTLVNGRIHHHRVVVDGEMLLVPPHWIEGAAPAFPELTMAECAP